MDWVAALLKLAHIGLAMAIVAGIFGRLIVLSRAAREPQVERAAELTALASPFERTVVVSSMAVVPAGLATAWAQGYPWLGLTTGWMLVSLLIYVALMVMVPTIFVPHGRVFEQAMTEARGAGEVTPNLRAAFADPAVRFARNAEIAGLVIIVALMVLKPF
jgi:hypothetical protein